MELSSRDHYRTMALQCAAAAEHTASPEVRQQLLELAKHWAMLADDAGGGLCPAPARIRHSIPQGPA
jgi:hypothetical protein